MSDRGLAKLCERHAIPVPGRGYWRRKETGKRVRQIPLPSLHPSHTQLGAVHIPATPSPTPKIVATARARPEPPLDPPLVADQRRVEASNPIVARDLPERPHPVVRATRSSLREARDGTTHPVNATGDNCFSTTVTAGTHDRALCIIQALCEAFKVRGFPLVPRRNDQRETKVIVHGLQVCLLLEERFQRKERPKPSKLDRLLDPHGLRWERYEYVATGELALKAWLDQRSPHKWTDGKRQCLEAMLNEVMIGLVAMVDFELRWRQERAERERREAEAQLRRIEQEERRREEEERGKDLSELVNAWHHVTRIRSFVEATRARAQQQGLLRPGSQLDSWLAWADEYVERCDPIVRLDRLPPPYKRRSSWDQEPAAPWPARPPAPATSPGPPRPGNDRPMSEDAS